MSDIKPLDLPSAAGVEFGRGDVRHFSEDDAVDVPGLQNPTRHLAQRDNLITTKVNEIVGVVNNKEQFVPLVMPKTTVPPGTEEIIHNFAIPDGFEARVLFARIASNPATSALALKIYYATGYGNSTGNEVVSTSTFFTSGAAFYNAGEFIVAVRNSGSTTIDASASITLTIRPIGSQASLLVGSVIVGPRGYPGGKGDHGGKGDPGVGGAGTPGLVWSGAFNSANSYNPPQVVSYASAGTTSSYVSILANTAPSVAPPNATYWDLVAQGVGATGTPGVGLTWRSAWVGLTAYNVNDAVSYTTGGVTSSYVCKLAVTSSTPPPSDPTHWDLSAGPGGGETPTYNLTALYTQFAASVTGPSDGIYGAVTSTGSFACREFSGTNTIGVNKGLAFLYGQTYINLPSTSAVTFTLPVSAATGAQWTNTEVAFNASAHGTLPGSGTIAQMFDLDRPSSSQWRITSLSAQPVHVGISVTGAKLT